MTFRSFAFGLTASFGIAWLAVVIVPFFLMRTPKPVSFDEVADGKEGIYHPKRAGRVINGADAARFISTLSASLSDFMRLLVST